MNLRNIYIIIVEPRTVGNIGSIARAMKNMGLKHLYLINPVKYKVPETYWMAWGAEDIVNRAKVFKSFSKAVSQMNFLIATTHRTRKRKNPYYTAKQVIPYIKEASSKNKVGLVFGRENNGLSNEELEKCNIISTVPNYSGYPSLNLAQAVMIYCYEIFQSINGRGKSYKWDLASKDSEKRLFKRINNILKRLDFKFSNANDHFMGCLKRVSGRYAFENRDIRLLHKVLDFIEKKIKK